MGEACSCPKGALRPPTNLRESHTRCPARRYLVQGQEGPHAEAHAADQFALSAGEPEAVSTHSLITPWVPAPLTHPSAGTPQSSLPMPGARQCQDVPPAPCFGQAWGNHVAQQGMEEPGWSILLTSSLPDAGTSLAE